MSSWLSGAASPPRAIALPASSAFPRPSRSPRVGEVVGVAQAEQPPQLLRAGPDESVDPHVDERRQVSPLAGTTISAADWRPRRRLRPPQRHRAPRAGAVERIPATRLKVAAIAGQTSAKPSMFAWALKPSPCIARVGMQPSPVWSGTGRVASTTATWRKRPTVVGRAPQRRPRRPPAASRSSSRGRVGRSAIDCVATAPPRPARPRRRSSRPRTSATGPRRPSRRSRGSRATIE